MILDTFFLIDVLRGDGAVQQMAEEIDKKGNGRLVYAAWKELKEILESGKFSEKDSKVLTDFLDSLNEDVYRDKESEEKATEILNSFQEGEETINWHTAQIAGYALTHDESIITRYPERYKKVPDAEVVSYGSNRRGK